MNPPLNIITMRDVKPETVEWLWESYIPFGKISLIQGDPGDGKTTTAAAVAAAVSRGFALPGVCSAVPADVIIQNAEDGLSDTIVPRLIKFGADSDRVHFIDEDEYALTLSDERIERSITEKSAKLCILDPIQAYLGGSNMNSANGVRPLMKQLAGIAERTGCAMLLVGHMNKKGGKAQYRGLGSVDIYAAARSVLTVGRISADDDMRAVVHNKSNLAAAGPSQAFGLDRDGGFTWLGEYEITIDELLSGTKKPESQFTKARRLIETELSRGAVPAADMMQTAEEQGISLKTLKRAKEALGVISVKRGAQWYWDLPVEVNYSEAGQESQQGQAGQYDEGYSNFAATLTSLAPLTLFNKEA